MLDEARSYLETNKPGKAYIGLVHRLDRPSSGVVAFAKTSKAAARLSESFRNRLVNKHYVCVVNGHLKDKQGTLHDNLVKSSKAKVRILNEATPLPLRRRGKGQQGQQGQQQEGEQEQQQEGGQEQWQEGPVVEARLHYSVRLQITRPSGRHREQSLLHVTLDTGGHEEA